LLLKSFPAVVLVLILALSFAVGLPLKPAATPNAIIVTTSTTTVTTTVTTTNTTTTATIALDIHVVNQYGLWYNGAVVEVFYTIPNSAPTTYSLVADGNTTNGHYYAMGLTPYSTYMIQVYTPSGAKSNQIISVGSNDGIVNFEIPSSSAPTLSLQNVALNPNTTSPGAPFSITANVVNTSNSTAYNTILAIAPPAQFSLLSTGSIIPLGILPPGASMPVTLLLSVSSTTATPGYTLAYILNYSDYSGVQYKTPGTMSLPSPPAPTLVIQNVSLNPTTIQPGTTFSLTAIVVNSSNSTALNSVLTITPPSQFSLLGTGSVIPLGTLQPGASKSLTLHLIVSNSGGAAANTIAYSLSYTDYFLNKGTTTGTLFVPVSGNPVQPKLIITTATFSSSAIHPGDNFSVPIVIENVGGVPANQVVLSVNATSPIASTGSAGAYRLGVVAGNGTISVKLGFSSPPAANLGSYPIVLTLAYADSFGTFYSNQQVLVATLVGQPSIVLNTFQFKNNPLTPGLQTYLNAQLLNVGGESALNVKVTFQDAPSFLNGTMIFLGSIRPGGTGNATAYLQIPTGTTIGAYQFNVIVSYTDSAGRSNQVVAPYTVTVAPFSAPKVSVTNTLLSPEVLTPGTQGTLTIYLRNDGASPANDLTLRLVNGSHLFSSDFFGLGTLNPSSSGTTTVGVNVSPNLAGGNYLVQIVANYTDANGGTYNFILPLEITVYATTNLLTLKNVGIGLAIAIVGVAVYAGITTRRKGSKPKATSEGADSGRDRTWEAPLVEKQSKASSQTQVDDKRER
jgi:hypothetical protein